MSTDTNGRTYKYSTGPDPHADARETSRTRSKVWQWEHQQGEPHLTSHALDRWDSRTDAASVAPETAWLDGVDVDLVTPFFEGRTQPHPPDEVRFHRPSGALFVRYDASIVTILRADGVDDGAVRAYIHAKADGADADGGEN